MNAIATRAPAAPGARAAVPSADSAPAPAVYDRRRRVSLRGLVGGAGALGVASVVAAGLNLLANLTIARQMSAAAFGDAAFVITVHLLASSVVVSVQLGVAHAVASGQRPLARPGRVAGITAAATVAAFALAMVFSGSFGIDSGWPLAVWALALPGIVVLGVLRGALQGANRYGALAGTFLLEAVVRFAATIALFRFGVTGVSTALALSVMVASLPFARQSWTAFARVLPHLTARPEPKVAEKARPASHVFGALALGQIVVANSDVIAVKMTAAAADAGRYAAVAMIGRVIYFLSWSVVNVAYPAMVGSNADGATNDRTRRSALRLLAVFAAAAVGALWLVGPIMMRILFADNANGLGSLVGPYALATMLFALVNLAAVCDVGCGRRSGVVALFAAGVAQTAGIVAFGHSLQAVVWIQVVVMAVAAVIAVPRRWTDAAAVITRRRPAPSCDTQSLAP